MQPVTFLHEEIQIAYAETLGCSNTKRINFEKYRQGLEEHFDDMKQAEAFIENYETKQRSRYRLMVEIPDPALGKVVQG